jgi:hypothetical protein
MTELTATCHTAPPLLWLCQSCPLRRRRSVFRLPDEGAKQHAAPMALETEVQLMVLIPQSDEEFLVSKMESDRCP